MKLSEIHRLWKLCQRGDMSAIHKLDYELEIPLFAIIHRFIDHPEAPVLLTDRCTRELWSNKNEIDDPVEFLVDLAVRVVTVYLETYVGVDESEPRSESWLRCQKILGDGWDSMNLDDMTQLRKLFYE
jgi:hypothetical protein